LKEKGRIKVSAATERQAVEAFLLLAKTEGILPALESAHALAYLPEIRRRLGEGALVVVNLSGRGDKDVGVVANYLGRKWGE
jgi:tryptophan synthase beta chain